MKELNKVYEPVSIERKIIQFWSENNFYTPSANSPLPKFSVVIPPPNVTGNLHVGHVLNNTIQDIYVRWKRMTGFNVLWLPGTDHAGIATQTVVEKKLKMEGLSKHMLGREKFIEKVWEWKDLYHKNIKSQLQRLGASVDWSRERFTMDEGLSLAVRKVFAALYKKGLIYKGKRIINWDPDAQTALSDEEVIFKEKNDKLYFVKYRIKGSEEYITIATTRPETILGDTAVAVNPEDGRYKRLKNAQIEVPLTGRIVPLIQDEYVDIEFGTGALKVTPAHDANDFEIGRKHNLETLQVIDGNGKLNKLAGQYKGLDRFAARKKVFEDLSNQGLIEKVEDYVHNIGYSERGNSVIEPYLSDQWFVSMKTLSVPALKVVKDGAIQFYPERWTKVYEHWMTNIKDWCISRQLWWGHRIPVWYNKNDGTLYCEIEAPKDIDNWSQDEDVLDTWFSSWLWPFSTMGWPEETEDLITFFPTDFLSTAPEIIFFWVARMIMASLEFTGKIPFETVYYHNIIRDDNGRKLSKSLGNSPDVIQLMDEFGADALRFTLVYLAPQGVDVYFDRDKCTIGRNFANKIWNAARFLLLKYNEEPDTKDLNETLFDRWIISRFNSALQHYIKFLNLYRIDEASKVLFDFIWSDFCDWYIEIVKIQSSADSKSVSPTYAYRIFRNIIKILHPVMPFITEELWQSFKNSKEASISIAEYPEVNLNSINPGIEKEVSVIRELITAVRNLRSELNLNPGLKCEVIIKCKSLEDKKLVNDSEDIIKSLCKISELTVILSEDGLSHIKSVSAVVNNYQVFLKVEGLIDIEEEKKKINKEIERIKGFLSGIEKKLSNENFISKASPVIVENEKIKHRDFKDKLEKLESQYSVLSKN